MIPAHQDELIDLGCRLVKIGLEIRTLSASSPDALSKIRELQAEIERLRFRFQALKRQARLPLH